MIVPANRLIWVCAATLLPGALLIAATPAARPLALLAVLGLLGVSALDLRGLAARRGRVRVATPDRVRMTQHREAVIPVELHVEAGAPPTARLALGLPALIASQEPVVRVALADEGAQRLDWACHGLRRGRYAVEEARVEIASPWGLFLRRESQPLATTLHVYPNLQSERRHLAAYFLHRGALGARPQRRVGKGREFEQLREYIPGDGFEDIHWKATARRGHPVTKVYQVERTQEIYVALDRSRLSARTVADPDSGRAESQLDRFITATLALGAVAERQGDLFGLITFDARVGHFVRAGRGGAHYRACRDALYTLEPAPVNPDYGEACSFIRTRLRRRALIFFLTNLDDPVLSEEFAARMQLIERRHLVLANMLLPPGVAPLFSRADAASVEDIYRRLAGHLQWQDLHDLRLGLRRRGVALHLLDQPKLAPELVTQYMAVKQRQRL